MVSIADFSIFSRFHASTIAEEQFLNAVNNAQVPYTKVHMYLSHGRYFVDML